MYKYVWRTQCILCMSADVNNDVQALGGPIRSLKISESTMINKLKKVTWSFSDHSLETIFDGTRELLTNDWGYAQGHLE